MHIIAHMCQINLKGPTETALLTLIEGSLHICVLDNWNKKDW